MSIIATAKQFLLHSESSPPLHLLERAAEVIINQAAKAIELEDIEARVAELERAAGTQKPGGRT